MKTAGIDFQSTPDYLSQKNVSLETKLRTSVPSTIDSESLKTIATLMHKIISIEIVESLWLLYRKAGVGELESTLRPAKQTNMKMWAKQVKLIAKQCKGDVTTIKDIACLPIVDECLREMNLKSEEYRRELNVKTSRLIGYNRGLEYNIEKFVRQGLESLRINIEQQKALVQYDYTNKIFKEIYLTYNSNQNQIESNSVSMNSQSKKNQPAPQGVTASRALWEPRPLTPTTTPMEVSVQQQTSKKKKKRIKRCHGNHKLRHFKKKCIRRGLNGEDIQKLMDQYKQRKNGIPNLRAKTRQSQLCQQFVENRLAELNQQYDQCTTELTAQSHSCPAKFLPLEKIDDDLKEFVQLEQKYFTTKINSRLTRYKDVIHENELWLTLCNPPLNIDQKNSIDQLLALQEKQLEVFENFLKLETQVTVEVLPKNFEHLEYFIAPNLYSPMIRDSLALELKQQKYKIIQEAKRTWLTIYIHGYETKYEEYVHQYQETLKSFELQCSNHPSQSTETTRFQSFLLYINHWIHRLKQEIYYQTIPIYRRKLIRLRRQWRLNKKKLVSISPRIIMDLIRHPFTRAELAFLSRGPSYIRSNQSALRRSDQRETQVDKELNNIMDKLKKYMSASHDGQPKIAYKALVFKTYAERLRTYLLSRYMTPLPFIDHLRARQELKLIKSILQKLKRNKLILRETDKSGVFHIGRASDYERKAIEYREKTGAYQEITDNPLKDIFRQVVQLLNQLRSDNKIKVYQQMKMMPIQNKIELSYMYFLPKAHKKGTPLRPIINTIHAATTAISKYLDQSIRPLFDRFARSTTILDGVDLLVQLQRYIEKARLVLQTNAFVYGKKLYRQIIGGAMGSAFTLTLANIFMWKWERQAILSKLPSHEFYGRYIDDIFFTSNETETTIKQWLKAANQFHPNIKLTYTMGKSVSFLDLLLTNNNGILSTSVYHKPSAEPAVLSFLSDHPRHVFRNVIQTALMRAIRYSSTFEAFNVERRRIRLTLLLNGYPTKYINIQFQEFFTRYLSSSSLASILPLIENEEQFFIIREKLLAQPSIQQIIVSKRAATVNTILHDQHIEEERRTTRDKDNKFKNKIFIHCTHEARLEGLKRYIHEIHDDIFKKTDCGDIRLIVGHRNNPNIEFELTRKRPNSSLLKEIPPDKKQKPNEPPATT
ncbi:unnamed protein product [Rotaria sp. Silwood1]|nr:unnamed protein product [Rotaria sp. Silwood1]